VARVLARPFALDAPQESAAFRTATWRIAGELVAGLEGRSAGDWNQALMELGALICVPREPRCLLCPVRAHCAAHAAGRTDELPTPKRRPSAIDVELHVALVRDGDRVLVAQRPPRGRMAELWELPTIEPSGAGLLADADWSRGADARPAIAVGDELGAVGHSITRHRIRARVFAARCLAPQPELPLRFVSAREIEQLGLTGLSAKVLRAAFARIAAG
jgi:A/G-specific adenine glycosylase